MKYIITPVPKPRMTRADRFKKRPAVLRYWAFKDKCTLQNLHIPESACHIIFHVPMPKSWSLKKRRKMCGTAHQQRPDVDNYLKAVLDAVYEDDSGVWDVRVSKFWSEVGMIEIKDLS